MPAAVNAIQRMRTPGGGNIVPVIAMEAVS
jgi:hypothetical protein